MIEITQYQCEICNKIHSDDQGAAMCEQNHMSDGIIEGYIYREGVSYPKSVIIKYPNGKIVRYSNVSIITTGAPE